MALHPSSQCLLLLPSLPSDLSLNSLRVAYGPALTRVFQELARFPANQDARYADVTLSVAVAYNGHSRPGYTNLQRIFAAMYRLTCIITTELSIDVQFNNDINIQILLLNSAPIAQSTSNTLGASRGFANLADFANSQRAWSQIYSIESESGEDLLKEVLRPRDLSTPGVQQHFAIIRVPGGLTMKIASNEASEKLPDVADFRNLHRSVAVGGTFDHLHAGHKLLLTMTALVLEPNNESDTYNERCLTIGITGDDLLKNKKYRDELETWEQRQDAVQFFVLEFLLSLSAKNVLKDSKSVSNPQVQGREIQNELQSGLRIKYKEIFDPFGPTLTDPKITALVISAETRAGGKAVNDKRTEKDWCALEVFEVDVLDATDGEEDLGHSDFESKISSTEIRSKIHERRVTLTPKSRVTRKDDRS